MTVKEQITQELDGLSEAQLQQIAEYLAFLKFKTRIRPRPFIDEAQMAALGAEFAEEDRELAEEGMADYAAMLNKEDTL